MSVFQVVFVALIIAITIFINRGGQLVFKRFFFIATAIIGFLLTIFPEVASRFANLVGIGRGADLVFYVFILFSWTWFSSTSIQLRRQDQRTTRIIRAIAITHPLKSIDEKPLEKQRPPDSSQ